MLCGTTSILFSLSFFQSRYAHSKATLSNMKKCVVVLNEVRSKHYVTHCSLFCGTPECHFPETRYDIVMQMVFQQKYMTESLDFAHFLTKKSDNVGVV